MILKNLMEDKQLDFNQPFLSVRRFSSTGASLEADEKRTDSSLPKLPPLPVYKSELKSGPVRNPGTVPFLWEKSPGRPKNETKLPSKLISPKLPPGRVPNVKHEVPSNNSKDVVTPRSQTEYVISSSRNVSYCDKKDVKYDSPGETEEEKGSSSSGEDDDAYLDALSRTESFFMNCSVSNLSELEGLDTRPVRTFSIDQQTRDFMMDRFLPAAKAMASETPQHAVKKQTIPQDQLKEVKMVLGGKPRPPNPYAQKVITHHAQDVYGEEIDDDDEEENGSEYSSANVCGLLPRFCLKSSFFPMNPVPGMRMQALPASSVRRVRNTYSSSASSCSAPENLRYSLNETRPFHEQQIAELHEEKFEVKCESGKINCKSNCQIVDGLSYRKELSQSRHPFPEGNVIPDASDKGDNGRVNGFDSRRRGRSNFRELLANESGSLSPVAEKTLYVDSVHKVKSPNSNSSYIRGCLTYDGGDDLDRLLQSSEMIKTPQLNSLRQNIKTLDVLDKKLRPKSLESVDSIFFSSSSRSNYEIETDLKDVTSDQDFRDVIKPTSKDMADDGMIDLESQFPIISGNGDGSSGLIVDSISLTKISGHRPNDLVQSCFTFTRSKYDHDKNLENKQLLISDVQEKSLGIARDRISFRSSKKGSDPKMNLDSQLQLSLALSLPQSPSESWLKRTLPTVTNLSSRSSLSVRLSASNSTSEAISFDSKWGDINKTSNVYDGHLRFPKEQLTSIPEA